MICIELISAKIYNIIMEKKEPGYVYILTNPSFREDWVKIGMTQNMEERLRTLDTTALPLPFKKYATLKTVKYQVAEKHVHHYIERFTNRRIRATREFFNVTPEEALSIFCEVAELLDDAVIEVFDENAKKQYIKESVKKELKVKKCVPSNKQHSSDKNTWLICYDKKYFDVEACFKKYGQIYWTHKAGVKNVQKGDIAYLYSSRPESAIRFKVEVIDSQLPYSPEMDIEDEFVVSGNTNNDDSNNKYFLVRLIGETNSTLLTHEAMMRQKVMSVRPSTTKLSKDEFKPLRMYIEKYFHISSVILPPPPKPKFKKVKQKTDRRPPFKFSMIGLKPGDVVYFEHGDIPVTVVSENTIDYNNETYTLSRFCKIFMPSDNRDQREYQGSRHFKYNGKTLDEIRKEMEK